MIEHPPFAFVFYDGVMVGAAADRVEYHALVFVGTEWVVGYGIGYLWLMTVLCAVGVRKVVLAVVLMRPDGFKEFIASFDDVDWFAVGYHVFVEFDAADGVLSHEEVGLSIVVDKYARVDEVAVADDSLGVDGHEWFAECIMEGTEW